MVRDDETPAIRFPAGAVCALFLAAVGATGCGDGLLGADGIGSLTGHDDLELPRDPAWMVRWILEDEVVDGPVMAADLDDVYPSYSEDDDTWYNYLNYVEVAAPHVSAPPPAAVRVGPHYAFAVGVPLLLDDLDGDGDHLPPDEEDPGELWGVTPESAYLFIEGDIDRFWDEQPVVPERWSDDHGFAFHLEEGTQNVWVNLELLGAWDWMDEWFEEWEEWEEDPDGDPEEGPEDLDLLAPDDPDVLTTDHEGAFRVAVARLVDSTFNGGVRAFLGEAWFAWFWDPDEEDEDR